MHINSVLVDIGLKYSLKQFILVMTGNVGCGKTTFIKSMFDLEFNPRFFSVDIDNISTMLEGNNYQRFSEQHFKVYGGLKREITESLVKRGYSVLVDGMHYIQEMRRFYINLGKVHKISVISVNCGKGDRDSLKRRIKEGRGHTKELWKTVHARTYNHFQKPEFSEGFDSLYEITSM